MTRIVIIGGGAAGIHTAMALSKALKASDNTEVVMIEKNAYYYHVVGTPRAFTDETYTPNLFVPYDNAIPVAARLFTKIVRGIATAIDGEKKSVSYQKIDTNDQVVETIETLVFDYLVLATGSTYTTPIKPLKEVHGRATVEAQIKEVREQIATAESILIVGGGPVGCELAGDISSKYPNKTVTLLESRDQLIAGSSLKPKFRTKLMAGLEKLKVKVILGERLEERLNGNVFEKRILKTSEGTEIESDIQLLCGGFSPVADLIKTWDSSLVNERGAVMVNDQLQLLKYPYIFALGDVSNHSTPKMSYWAGEQGKFLAKQLVAVIHAPASQMKPFPPVKVEGMIVPLGPNGGVSQLPVMGGSVVGDMMTRMVKSKDMFAAMIWGQLGATLPPPPSQ